MLDHTSILIVEDEPLIALELQASVEDLGGTVVGPVGSVHAAMELLKTDDVEGAILDVQLSDGDVTPVAQMLAARDIPMILQSGITPPPNLRRVCPDAVLYRKPVSASLLLDKLTELIARQIRPASLSDASPQ